MTDPLAVVAVSVPEAARLLSVSVSTIRKLAPPVRIGRWVIRHGASCTPW